jgi:hypothetical protein
MWRCALQVLLAIKLNIPFNDDECSKLMLPMELDISSFLDSFDSVGNLFEWNSSNLNHGFNLQVWAKHEVQPNLLDPSEIAFT